MTKTIEGKKKYIQHSVQNFKKTKKEKKKTPKKQIFPETWSIKNASHVQHHGLT